MFNILSDETRGRKQTRNGRVAVISSKTVKEVQYSMFERNHSDYISVLIFICIHIHRDRLNLQTAMFWP